MEHHSNGGIESKLSRILHRIGGHLPGKGRRATLRHERINVAAQPKSAQPTAGEEGSSTGGLHQVTEGSSTGGLHQVTEGSSGTDTGWERSTTGQSKVHDELPKPPNWRSKYKGWNPEALPPEVEMLAGEEAVAYVHQLSDAVKNGLTSFSMGIGDPTPDPEDGNIPLMISTALSSTTSAMANLRQLGLDTAADHLARNQHEAEEFVNRLRRRYVDSERTRVDATGLLKDLKLDIKNKQAASEFESYQYGTVNIKIKTFPALAGRQLHTVVCVYDPTLYDIGNNKLMVQHLAANKNAKVYFAQAGPGVVLLSHKEDLGNLTSAARQFLQVAHKQELKAKKLTKMNMDQIVGTIVRTPNAVRVTLPESRPYKIDGSAIQTLAGLGSLELIEMS